MSIYSTIWTRLLAPGNADWRPCGCLNDPGVFGHTCYTGKDRYERDF